MVKVGRYAMTKAKEYKNADERGWREQAMPLHPTFSDMAKHISEHLERVHTAGLLTVNAGLSTVVEASVNYAYQQWIERKADYPEAVHDSGVQLYGTVVLLNQDTK